MTASSLDIGLAFDLKSDFAVEAGAPPDALEEYDSRETVERIAGALRDLGHRPRLLGGGRRFLEAMLSAPPQLVFNLAEGRGARGREAQVPAVCEMLGVACTHSDPATLSLCLDKALAKRIVAAAGVRTPAFHVVESLAGLASVDLPFPLFVKPVGEGSSMGVRSSSRVADAVALAREVERCLADYRQPVLVETFLPGLEATVGVCGPADVPRVLRIMEIAPASGTTDAFVYGLEAKHEWQARVCYSVPPKTLKPSQCDDLAASACAAYRALGCRDVARLDLRLDAQGQAHFIEANPLPGLSPVSDLVLMLEWSGAAFHTLIGTILGEARRRYPDLA